MSLRRWAAPAAILIAVAVTAGACAAGPEAAESSLSPAASEGRAVSLTKGCAACHGRNGEGGVAPTWIGLAGSTVSFADGTTAVADADYLTRSITDPSAQIREGFALQMPENNLTDDEVAKVVAYIEALR